MTRTVEMEKPRRSRLPWLVAIGGLAVLVAIGFRFSPWGNEFRLRRADLGALRQMAAGTSHDPLVFYYLGAAAYNAHSLGEAAAAFEKAVTLDPKMTRAYMGLALVQRDIGRSDSAFENARRAEELAPNDPDAAFLAGMAMMSTSRVKAIPEFQKVTRLRPQRADGWYWLGTCESQINQTGEAIAPLKKAADLEPKNALYRRDLGRAYLETNFFNEARSALELARRLAPDDPQTVYLLGETILKLAQSEAELQQADSLFADAAKLLGTPTPQNAVNIADVAGKRAEVAKRLRQPKQALAFLKTARKYSPRNIRYIYDQAEVDRMLGHEAEASRLMQEYTQISSQLHAAFQLEERVKQDPKNPTLRLQLARAYVQTRDYPRAINLYEYCLYLDPHRTEARRELEQLSRKLASSTPKQNAAVSGGDAPSRPAAK